MSFLRRFSFPRAFQPAFPKLKYFSSVQTGNWNSFQQKFYQFKRFQSSSKPLLLLENDKENPKVKILKFNSPETRNALTVEMGEKFEAICKDLCSDSNLRCLVLTGEGKAFSAGGDLQFILDRSNDTPQNNSVIMRKYYSRFLEIRKVPVPVISCINGSAIGAGMCLALATDLRIASSDAQIGFTFASLGIHPGMGGTHFLPALVGSQIATKMLLTGALITGKEARDLGLVLEHYEPSEVLNQSLLLARNLASQSSISVQTCVRTLRNELDEKLETALWREADSQAICYAHKDIKEGLAAIKEKRKPKF